MTTTATHILRRPGVRLRYEVRGSGPLLVVTGAPMAAAEFAPLAEALAADHTVVTHDPRGMSGSVLDDPAEDSTPEPTTSRPSSTTSGPSRPTSSAAAAAR
jgi:pimeloyl-ACP methyl ester carboxylesterase